MAVVVQMEAKGLTIQQYDQANAMMQGKLPPGCLAHAAYVVPGGMHFVDVWESEGEFETFAKESLSKMAEAVGMNPPEVQIMPAHDYQHA
jgi:hypothetical protein